MAAAPASTAAAASRPVVVVNYEDLTSGADLSKAVHEAYGFDGYGILAVRGVPGLQEKRRRCLPLAHRFANLPEGVQAKYVHAASSYSFGWSHGKEKMKAGVPDWSKGSFYANPTYDQPFGEDPASEALTKYASFAHPNIWPSEADCPGFAPAFKALGQLIVDTGGLLSSHIDAYVRQHLPSYPRHGLEMTIRTSRVTKGRLLYYFPQTEEQLAAQAKLEGSAGSASASASASGADEDAFDSWCGWHNDHGSLTGLAPAMYVDGSGAEVPCPDPAAGLYVRSRHGETVRVAVPPDCLAFQIGETAQIHSGGILQATPHAVRAAAVPGIGRATMAVFMEPEWGARMGVPAGADPSLVLRGSHGELLPKGVPPLVSRWAPEGSQDFGQFTEATLSAYYA